MRVKPPVALDGYRVPFGRAHQFGRRLHARGGLERDRKAGAPSARLMTAIFWSFSISIGTGGPSSTTDVPDGGFAVRSAFRPKCRTLPGPPASSAFGYGGRISAAVTSEGFDMQREVDLPARQVPQSCGNGSCRRFEDGYSDCSTNKRVDQVGGASEISHGVRAAQPMPPNQIVADFLVRPGSPTRIPSTMRPAHLPEE